MKRYKKFIKFFQNNENNISMVLGIIVILIVGFFIINNFNIPREGETIPSIGTEQNENVNKTYSVQKGDDLWKISEKFYGTGYDWKIIADANDIKPPYVVETGELLIIPSISQETITPEVSPTQTLPTPTLTLDENEEISELGTIDTNTYTVVKGDNLWTIALRSYGDGYRWVDIARANNLSNPNLIHPGNVFVIPR